jgi:hypothetical protein
MKLNLSSTTKKYIPQIPQNIFYTKTTRKFIFSLFVPDVSKKETIGTVGTLGINLRSMIKNRFLETL